MTSDCVYLLAGAADWDAGRVSGWNWVTCWWVVVGCWLCELFRGYCVCLFVCYNAFFVFVLFLSLNKG